MIKVIYKHAGKEIHQEELEEVTVRRIEQIQAHFGQFDKTLQVATYTIGKKTKGQQTIEFAKKTGTKGNDDFRAEFEAEKASFARQVEQMTEALLGLPEKDDPAVEMLIRAEDGDRADVVGIAEVIRTEAYESRVWHERISKCLQLTPVPGPKPPIGF